MYESFKVVLVLVLFSLASCTEERIVHRFVVEHPDGIVYRETMQGILHQVADGSGVEHGDVVWPTELNDHWVKLENGYWLPRHDDYGRPLLRKANLRMSEIVQAQWDLINESGDHDYDLGKHDDVNGFHDTALHRAAKDRHVELVEWCLKHKAPVNVQSLHGSTPLHDVASMWKFGINSNKVAIAEAPRRNELAELLLASGADVNIRDDEFFRSCTPLHRAAQHGFTEITRMVLDSNADPNAQDTQFRTPIAHAMLGKGDWVGVAWLLYERGADLAPMDAIMEDWHVDDPRRQAIQCMLDVRVEAEREGRPPSGHPSTSSSSDPTSPGLPPPRDQSCSTALSSTDQAGTCSRQSSVEGTPWLPCMPEETILAPTVVVASVRPSSRASVNDQPPTDIRPSSRPTTSDARPSSRTSASDQTSTPAGRAATRGVMLRVQSEAVLSKRDVDRKPALARLVSGEQLVADGEAATAPHVAPMGGMVAVASQPIFRQLPAERRVSHDRGWRNSETLSAARHSIVRVTDLRNRSAYTAFSDSRQARSNAHGRASSLEADRTPKPVWLASRARGAHRIARAPLLRGAPSPPRRA